MARVLWVVGEVVAGLLVSGGIGGIVVPVAARMGWATGPWMLWPLVAVGILVGVVLGERLRRGLRRP